LTPNKPWPLRRGEETAMTEQCLECPTCGNDNLHQTKVDVFMRTEEGTPRVHARCEQTGLWTPGAKASVVVDDDMTGNPSSCRYGLSIEFLCEHCEESGRGRPVLAIWQRKGCTYWEWGGKGVYHNG
jgi:hypothetical protein